MTKQSMTTSMGAKTARNPKSKLDALRESPSLPMLGFFVFQMVLGFEWFWSGLAKIIMPGGFPAALPEELGEIAQNAPAWYANFLTSIVISNAAVFGYVIEISELLIGAAFLFGPLIWFFAWERMPNFVRTTLFPLTAIAAFGGFFMAVNFHIAMGYGHPWILPTSGLDESVDFDSMIAAMQIVILMVNITLLGYLRQKKTEAIAISRIGQPEYAFVEVTRQD